MVIPLSFLWFFVGLFFGFLAACILMALDGEGDIETDQEDAEQLRDEAERLWEEAERLDPAMRGKPPEPSPPLADRFP